MERRIYKMTFLILLSGFRKPYNPPAISSPGSYLVVEGMINSESDSTVIKLSRSVSIAATNVNNPLTGATLAVQGDQKVGSASVKGIFIHSQQLPAWTPVFAEVCALSICLYNNNGQNEVNEHIDYNVFGNPYPLIPASAMGASPIAGYLAAAPECTDCTLHGPKMPPAFWQS
jgi:hypothetical protein